MRHNKVTQDHTKKTPFVVLRIQCSLRILRFFKLETSLIRGIPMSPMNARGSSNFPSCAVLRIKTLGLLVLLPLGCVKGQEPSSNRLDLTTMGSFRCRTVLTTGCQVPIVVRKIGKQEFETPKNRNKIGNLDTKYTKNRNLFGQNHRTCLKKKNFFQLTTEHTTLA